MVTRASNGRFSGHLGDKYAGLYWNRNVDPITQYALNEFMGSVGDRLERVSNATLVSEREGIGDNVFDKRRDINKECGYEDNPTIKQFKILYDREPLANRIVNIIPDECWMLYPSVVEDEDANVTTPFEEAFNELGMFLREDGDVPNWHSDEEANPIFGVLQEADRRSGVGSFGIVLLGIDDGKDLIDPAEPREGQKLIFLEVFDEYEVEVETWDNDPQSRRYLQPTVYSIEINKDQRITGAPNRTVRVHWTRIIHIEEMYRKSRLLTPYNRVIDCRKLYGGSAEMYWRGAFPGYSVESHPQLGANVRFNRTKLRAEMQNFLNLLDRAFMIPGASIKSLAPQVVDPTPQIDVQIENICIQLGVPKRIFVGSERGELASSQDDSQWNDRLSAVHKKHTTPNIIVKFINRLIWLGVLPQPANPYKVKWPDLRQLDESVAAEIERKRTESIVKFVQGDGENAMSLMDFYTRIMSFSQDEAIEIVSGADPEDPEEETEDDAGRERLQ